jgi:putative SOS response-associated peptidase YedK
MLDRTGNLPPLPGIFPDYAAPIVRNQPDGRELTMARWGMPSPFSVSKGRNSDPGVTNVRNVGSPHWRRWLAAEHRCVVPFTSFAEHELLPDGSRPPVWFALDATRPLACFAGIWTRWTSVRKVKEGETTNDLFAFLTTEAKQCGRSGSPEGDARDPDNVAGDRWLDDRAGRGGAKAATTAC